MQACGKYKKYLVTVFVMIFCCYHNFVIADNSLITSLYGKNNSIAKDSSVTSKDTIFFSSSLNDALVKPYPVKDVITFRIDENSGIVLPSSFTAVVHLRVYYTNANNNKDSLNDLRLVLSYNSTIPYSARTSFIFSGAYSVKIKVLSDTIASSIMGAMVIDNEVMPDRKYKFACTGKDITQITNQNVTGDALVVAWNNVIVADEYDLEWAFLDSNAVASGTYNTQGNLDPNLIFTNNSTRVSISDLSYKIPLIFPGPGSVFVRVRTAYLDNNSRLVSNWSSNYVSGLLRYNFSGHEQNLNWQSSVSFAEDGKSKVVVQYFDGSLRSRETVTKDKSTNTTITAETFYDYQGRPTINVLPAPSLNTVIQFTRNYNRVNGQEYDKSYFDSVISPQTSCSMAAPAMDSTYGASEYYSANNAVVESGKNGYLPESYGYPFTQTEYTQDNTGRISRQGGVGKEFRLNSGHETKYYYAVTPDQNELDALFGTEAGYHTHYFKNAVRDANGQYSVSYVDMHGRTIATALAGDAPRGLTALPSNQASTITENLADASTNVTDGLSMTSHKSMLIEKAGSQHFVYSLNPQTLQIKNCANNQICYDCLYDLNITITDDCGNNKNNWGGHPLIISKPNLTVADAICNASGIVLDTTINLDEGNYEVTKTLSVNQASGTAYRDNIFTQNNVCKTVSNFIAFQQQAIPHGNCNLTCESCRASIGTYSSFRNNYMTSVYGSMADSATYRSEIQAAYNSALASCDAYCDDVVTEENSDVEQAMLFDMSPKSGQYANLDSAADIYSIFHVTNGSQVYQQLSGYKNENGQLDSVWDNTTNQKVPPQQLDATQFAQNFKSSWAATLLPSHPEYCKLTVYKSHLNAYSWDKKFKKISSYAQALSLGYANPLASGTNQDPVATYAILKDSLSSKYANFITVNNGSQNKIITMWQMATLNTKCPGGDETCINNAINAGNYTLSCAGDSNAAWQNFQQLYSNYRNELLNQSIPTDCPSATAAALINDNHYLEFTTAAAAISSSSLGYVASSNKQQLTDSANAQTKAYYKSNCEAYKALWTQQLLPGYLQTQVDQILPMLVDVCVAGADLNHPFGSRDISVTSPSLNELINNHSYAVRSFDDIIDSYNNTYSIAKNIRRTADVITQPAPYASQQVYTQPIITKPTATECSQINYYNSSYQSSHLAGETFSQYLKRRDNTDISDSDLQILLNSCAVTGSCNYLQKPVNLPPLFQDGAGNPCTDCYAFNTLIDQYKNKYGDSSYPVITNQVDTLQQRKNQLFANFMNNQLGYNLTAAEYMAFIDKCKGFGDSGQSGTPQYVQPISDANRSCFFSSSQSSTAPIVGYPFYIHNFNTATSGSSYNMPADLVYLSQNNNSSWTNSTGSWSSTNGFTGNALQINSATSDTTILTLIYTVDDSSKIQHLTDVGFYDASSDSGYTKWMLYINDKFESQGALNNGSLLHPSGGNLNNNDSYIGIKQFVVKLKLFGGLHGHTATFKLDDFTLYGRIDNVYSYNYASNDKVQTYIYYGAWDTSNHSYPYNSFIGQPIYFTSNSWTNSYNKWLNYIPQNDHLTSSFGISSAEQDTAYITATFNIKKGYTLNIKNFNWQASTSPDSGYTKYSVCMNSRFIGQDSLGNNYFGGLFYDGGNYWKTTKGSLWGTQNYNTVENVSNQVTLTIKLFGGLHGKSSKFIFNHLNFGGFINQINDSIPLLCGRSQPAYPTTQLPEINSCTDSTFYAVSSGTEMYNNYTDSLKNNFDSLYHAKCLNAYNYETFTVTHTVSEYHYTLYYYDQAGNLVQTIPPKAVRPNWNTTYLAQVKTKRISGDTLRPGHDLTLATEYRYNTLNQVIAQKSPDGGSSGFYYDRLGRLVLSQNAKQSPSHKFSYTTYDAIGRITEVGELINASTMNATVSKTPSQLQSWLSSAAGSRTQITQTVYDIPYFGIDSIALYAKNLRNRVSYSQYFATASDQSLLKIQSGTYYSYDIEGNADTLLQDYTIPSLASGSNRFFKKIVYQYDLISGKVNAVAYNPGNPDAFYHRYTYDNENRITNVETSIDSIYWENEAFYKYYKHGPLSRMEVGELQVQGVDYAYTLQGWLKGINTTNTGTFLDMGSDGFSTGHIQIAKDAFGFALYYFNNDYKCISNNAPFAPLDTVALSSFKPLYNGNIAAMGENLPSFTKPLLFNYGYDQLNRLIQMRTFKNSGNGFTSPNNTWIPVAVNDYNEDIAYDANGNIQKYKRYGNVNANLTNATVMDSLSYYYEPNSNKLDRIKDSIADASYTVDIDNQSADNYGYDSIGNLVRDNKEGIDSILWTVYGKIQKVYKHNGTVISYSYDASGNRISKIVTGASSGNGETWYVHDASGNTMSVYNVHDNTINAGALTLSEQDIYGSSRVGMYKPNLNLNTFTAPSTIMLNSLDSGGYFNNFIRGKKFFELDNHLGNVLVTISDKKIANDNNNDGIVNYYMADIVSAQEYYPGGMQMPGRTYTTSSSYRYGFNGKEMDNETYGQGNEYDYGDRIYNPRSVTWLSVDPLQQKYPGESPYMFVGGNPILYIDRDGRDRHEYIKIITDNGTTLIRRVVKHAYQAEAVARYNGGYYFRKYDYSVYTTIDKRSGVSADRSVTTYTETNYSAPKEISLSQYLKIKVLGKDNNLLPDLPQVIVYGSGTSDPGWGTKADPKKGIFSINFAELNSMIGLSMQGMSVPDLKKIDITTLPSLVDKARKIYEYEQKYPSQNNTTTDAATNQTVNTPSSDPSTLVNKDKSTPDSIFITDYRTSENGDTISISSKPIKNPDKKKP